MVQISTVMKGVNYVTDSSNKKVAVQIDLKLLEKYDEEMEDLIDGIIAESRKDERRKPLGEVIKDLKKRVSSNEAVHGCINANCRKRTLKAFSANHREDSRST